MKFVLSLLFYLGLQVSLFGNVIVLVGSPSTDTYANYGDNITLRVVAYDSLNNGPLYYTWQRNGSTLAAGSDGLSVSQDLIHDDMPVMILTSLACLPIFWTKGRISRLEGGLLVGLYVLYITDNVLPRTGLSSWSDEFRLIMLCVVLPAVVVLITVQAARYWRQLKRKGA